MQTRDFLTSFPGSLFSRKQRGETLGTRLEITIFIFFMSFTGCLIAGFLLMTEMATPQWRRWANCLSQVAYGVGIAVQALIA